VKHWENTPLSISTSQSTMIENRPARSVGRGRSVPQRMAVGLGDLTRPVPSRIAQKVRAVGVASGWRRTDMQPPNSVRPIDDVPPADRLAWRLDDIAQSLGISRRALERERSAGRFPRPDLTIGRMPLWKPETVRRWIEDAD
jgi:predicted DNA-binding transcriptional regulator AlpA